MKQMLSIAFLFFFFTSGAQVITGKVLSEKGLAAASVSVSFKNKANSVVTNPDGTFSIRATKLPDTLVFSALGMEPYTVVVTEKTLKDPNFEVVMLNKREALAEVVVAGYADVPVTAHRRDMSSGISGSAPGIRVRGASSKVSGEYLNAKMYHNGKKLFMYDSLPFKKDTVIYRSGLLTAGEVNDFNKWKMWEDLTDVEFKVYGEQWGMFAKKRYCVQMQNKDHKALVNQPVYLINASTKDTVWRTFTDNTGKAELWAEFDGKEIKGENYVIVAKDQTIRTPDSFENGVNKVSSNTTCSVSNAVEIAFVVDATGSMGDEIEFLKLELEDVIRKTFTDYSDLDLRVSSVFYRDNGDEYTTRKIDFQTDLLKVLNFIKLQSAGGGGDKPEAVDEALETALDSLSWSATSRSRILFLILDAPPHGYARDKMIQLTLKAAAKGVRIVPVVCSGADKPTEFIMRSMALATNGTYAFLTDNSGIGLPHTKPTTDAFSVELFNALLQRLIRQMIFVPACDNALVMVEPKNIPLNVEGIKIFPNPTRGDVKIESGKELKQMFVTDFTGKILMNVPLNKNQKQWKFNISSYPSGTYLVKYITKDDRWGAEKVLLMH
jgi:hypothetical protein